MKRKLKIAGLAIVLVSLFSVVVQSAVSGGVGFGIAVIICFFLGIFALCGNFFLLMSIYKLLKKQLSKSVNVEKGE